MYSRSLEKLFLQNQMQKLRKYISSKFQNLVVTRVNKNSNYYCN